MTINFDKTTEMNAPFYVKVPFRNSAILNNVKYYKNCFLWSILASFHPCKSPVNRVSNHRQFTTKLNNEGFDISNGFNCTNKHRFETLYRLCINIFELGFYQDQNEWRHKFLPFEISKKESDRIVDFLFCKNHYVLIKKLHLFLGTHNCKYVCRRCMSPYSIQNIRTKHKQRCDQQEITSVRTSNEPQLYWKKHFHKNPLYFTLYAGFAAYNEFDNSFLGNRTTESWTKSCMQWL